MPGILMQLMKDTRDATKSGGDTSLTFMHYDRIKLSPVDDYNEFFYHNQLKVNGDQTDANGSYTAWVGEKQSIYMYDLEEDPERYRVDQPSISDGHVVSFGGATPRFLCVCVLNLSGALRKRCILNGVPFAEYIRVVAGDLRAIVGKSPSGGDPRGVYQRWYGTLGQEDFVLLLGSDSVKAMTEKIELVRCAVYPMSEGVPLHPVDYSYSFIATNCELGDDLVLDVACDISVTLNASAHEDGYVKALEQCLGNAPLGSMGKYDLHIHRPAGDPHFRHLFGDQGLLNLRAEISAGQYGNDKNIVVADCVLQSKTTLLYDISEECRALAWTFGDEVPQARSTVDEVSADRVDEVIKNCMLLKRSPALAQAMWLMYSDYLRCVKSPFTSQWHSDLRRQFSAFLDLLQGMPDALPDPLYTSFEKTISAFRQTYVHIHQASRLFFDMPTTNLRYHGSYNHVLRAYFGIIKTLLLIAYQQEREAGCEQPQIVPMVAFEHSPLITSETLFYGSTRTDTRLITFRLPFASLTNMPKYARCLCHEIVHCVCPANRVSRNRLLEQIWLENAVKRAAVYYLESKLGANCRDCAREFVLRLTPEIENEVRSIPPSRVEGYYQRDFNQFVKALATRADLSALLRHAIGRVFLDQGAVRRANEGTNNIILSQEEKHALEQIVEKTKSFSSEQTDDTYNAWYGAFEYSTDGGKPHFYKGYETFEALHQGIREATADYFFLQITGRVHEHNDLNDREAPFYGYLAMLCAIMFESSEDIKIASTDFQVRIGMIIDAMYGVQIESEGTGLLHEFLDRALDACVDELKRISNIQLNTREQRCYAEGFIGQLKRIYNAYRENFGRYRACLVDIVIDSFRPAKNADIAEELSIFRTLIEGDAKAEGVPGAFVRNIQILEAYQDQLTLKDIYRRGMERCAPAPVREAVQAKAPAPDVQKAFMQRNAYSLSDYLSLVEYGAQALGINRDALDAAPPIWYRGQIDAKYTLLPSLFRDLNQCGGGRELLPPFEVQLSLLNAFRARASCAPELNRIDMQCSMEWLVNMQHYGVNTSLLDWSENAMVALYFAICPFKKLGKEAKACGETDAAVYLLNPVRMNAARERLIQHARDQKGGTGASAPRRAPLPNLSNPIYAKEHAAFMLESCSDSRKANDKWADGEIEGISPEETRYPLAMLTPTINTRVRAQFGTFTACSLYSRPEKGQERPYEYLTLEKMQDEYLKIAQTDSEFLCKIVINRYAANRIATQLHHMGYTDMRMYPELERIANSISGQIRGHFSL